MLGKRQLLCTFSNTLDLDKIVKQIRSFYNIQNNCIFVFYNEKNDKELFLTYNIINEDTNFPKFPNTILIHRKKQTCTLFSLNALNFLIRDENGGVPNKEFQLNWELYKNSLIISGEVSVRIIPIRILRIIK
jgi:hypothetical protein